MSTTPVRRSGPAPRPRYRTPGPAPRRPAATAEALPQQDRVYASPLARAFPIPALSTDTLIAGGLILLAFFLRVVMLGDRALHHDESLHATYAWYLMGRDNPEYHYDPMMHGPLQFHMIAFFYSILGSSPFAARMWSASAGTALVAVPLLLRRQLGRWPMFALMAILCLGPTSLYFARFAREDMQFGLFNFLMVAALIRYIADHREGSPYFYRWLYLLATAFIMAYAAKESIYLSATVLGSFLIGAIALEIFREGWQDNSGVVITALRRTPGKAWGLSAAIVVAMFILLYWPIGDPPSWAFIPGSNMVSTTLEIPGKATPVPYRYSTDGLIGGLLYWQAQEPVARGGQPWFYYFLVIPLYEWLVVPFGIAGGIWIALRRRTFTGLLLLWWAIASMVIYGWSSEKMPWNSLHLVIPLSVLAAIGLVVGVTALRRWVRYLSIVVAVFTALITVHNSFTLAYLNGANPVEYYVYVQTSPDVPAVYDQLQRIQSHLGGTLQLQVDNDDTWPWAFYLRDPKRWQVTNYPSKPSDYGAITQPVLIVGVDNYPALSTSLAPRYVAFRENLRWWNPEEYKAAYVDRTDANGQVLSRLGRLGVFLHDAISPSTWSNIIQWELFRKPFTPHAWDNYANQLDFYFVVRKNLVPYLSPKYQREAQQQIATQAQHDPFLNLARQLQPTATFATAPGGFTSVGPVTIDRSGRLLVADPSGRKLALIGANGATLRSWGSAGTGNGQFNGQFNPGIGGVAVAPDGTIYATDTWNGRVEEFTPGGAFVRAWGRQNLSQDKLGPYDFYGPRGVAVAPNGDVYVADTGHKRIQVFDKDGRFLFGFGTPGSLPGQFDEPSSVAIDQAGKVYVADYWNQRVQVLDPQGHPLALFTVASWQTGSYDEPYIAVDSRGYIYVPDPDNARVLVYSPTGKPIVAWGGITQFGKPLSVAVGPHNTILVGDAGNNRVLQFTAP